MQTLHTEILIVGGGTGGTASAIQAARRGAKTILVSEGPWLGGMLTSAGVTAPDGNELAAFQTGLWGAFLRELEQRQPDGLDHGWVSFFTYEPKIGAAIFADWVAALPNLQWIAGQVPRAVLRQGDRVLGVQFDNYTIHATITIDGTELGDLLALGNIPHRWGWELQAEFNEPSAPVASNELTQTYPVQAPTWVVVLQDFGPNATAPEIVAPPGHDPNRFAGAWTNYGGEAFLNYGRLPGDRFMINWPIHGNDYGEGVQRLIGSPQAQQQFWQEARWHSQSFACHIQTQLGRRYGLATDTFPVDPNGLGGGAFALHPYYRESRRLEGLTTVREQDLLPLPKGAIAPLPLTVAMDGCVYADNVCDAIAIGNYANDHHYPSGDIQLAPKSFRWGGRWTGTPFTIPYRALIPKTVDGFLACEKNISVTHMANGATRLQPVVLGIGQAAGMAAALCIEQQCQPRHLAVRSLQQALIEEPTAPAAVVPLLNVEPNHPEWVFWQTYYLEQPESLPATGNAPLSSSGETVNLNSRSPETLLQPTQLESFVGTVNCVGPQVYGLKLDVPQHGMDSLALVTLAAGIDQQLAQLNHAQRLLVRGRCNVSGQWLVVTELQLLA